MKHQIEEIQERCDKEPEIDEDKVAGIVDVVSGLYTTAGHIEHLIRYLDFCAET